VSGSPPDPVLPALEFLIPPQAQTAAESETVPAPSAQTISRFWSRVVTTPTCWWWTGAISSPDGYGRITYSNNAVPVTLSAHRFALLLANGGLAAGDGERARLQRNPLRTGRPDHAHAGTQTANLRYAVSLGRHRGSRPGNIDPRGRYHRALAMRTALAEGYDPSNSRKPATPRWWPPRRCSTCPRRLVMVSGCLCQDSFPGAAALRGGFHPDR